MEERRILLALALSAAVLFAWSYWVGRQAPRPAVVPEASGTEESAAVVGTWGHGAEEAEPWPFRTGVYSLVFDRRTGGLRNAELLGFDEADGRKKVDLLGGRLVGAVGFGLVSSKGVLERGGYGVDEADGVVRFVRRTTGGDGWPAGLELEREYRFREGRYLFETVLRVRNVSRQAVDLSATEWSLFRTVVAVRGPKGGGGAPYDQMVLSYARGGDVVRANSGDKIRRRQRSLERSADYEWAALADRYFLMGFVAADRRMRRPVFEAGDGVYVLGVEEAMPPRLGPGEAVVFRYFVYAGPKDRDIFRAYRKEYPEVSGLVSFERAMGFSRVLGPVANLLLDVLDFFHRFVGNYGWSIVLVTVLIKVVFFPLTYGQYASMERMRALQPALEALKARYRNDPQAMNRETVALYRKHRINPLGGCLPLLLQIPVFFAFYDLLAKSIKLRGASFLWIRDLARPDTVATVAGIPLNVLPLLMAATTLLQQATAPGVDPQQRKVMMVMPLVFLFLFWNLPAGLTLYWTAQNVLGLAEQLAIRHRLGRTKAS